MMLEPQASHPSLQDLAPTQILDEPYADEEARPHQAKEAEDGALGDEVEPSPARNYWPLIRLAAAGVLVVAIMGFAVWLWPSVEALYRMARAPEVEKPHEAPPSTRPKIADRIEPGGQQNPPAQVTTVGPGTSAAGAAVAQRVVLYEEDPNDSNGKRFVGSAIWRTETITPGPG